MRPGPERRRAPRVPGRVRYSAGRVEGEGLIEDLSLTGLQLNDTVHRLEPGTVVELYLCVEAVGGGFLARAEVIRKSATGFAVHFTRKSSELQRVLLAAVPAMAAIRPKS